MQTVTITTPNTPAPEGHEAAMIAKVDASQAAATAAAGSTAPVAPVIPERPAHIPEKFWDAAKGEIRVEDLAKSYAALEAKQGQPAATPPVTPPAAPAADPAAAAAASKAGLDLSALETEYRTDGKVSDANLAKLQAAGFSEADVQTYIAGRQAMVAQFETAVLAEVPGGAEKYGEMTAWAKANLTEPEINAFNKAVDSGDVNQAKLAVAGLGAKFTASVGNEPNLVGGRTTAAPGDVYASMAQVTADMKDPRYAKDPAYRAMVSAKLGRSDI